MGVSSGGVQCAEHCSLVLVQPFVASISRAQTGRLVSHYISPSSLSHSGDSGGGDQKTEEELRGDWILSDVCVVTLLQSQRRGRRQQQQQPSVLADSQETKGGRL